MIIFFYIRNDDVTILCVLNTPVRFSFIFYLFFFLYIFLRTRNRVLGPYVLRVKRYLIHFKSVKLIFLTFFFFLLIINILIDFSGFFFWSSNCTEKYGFLVALVGSITNGHLFARYCLSMFSRRKFYSRLNGFSTAPFRAPILFADRVQSDHCNSMPCSARTYGF